MTELVCGKIHMPGEMLTAFERQSEWLLPLGRKTAVERVAFLFQELHDRL
ncbi:hypothetical protein [Novosphingobium sp. 9]|nr:hypothetical protein [Novosphingobium sp. 9]